MSSSQGVLPTWATWPLVGRAKELTAIRRAMDGSAVTTVVIAGAAGVGKTRLAREALEAAQAQGLAIRWAVATQTASAIPFGALAQVLPDSSEQALNQADLLRRAVAALQAQAGSGRLVLGIDDAHVLDDLSAALIHQLAGTAAVVVLVTVRTGEPVPDPLISLWKDDLAERLELQALSRDEVEELVTAILCGRVDALTLHRLWTATAGNALLLRELVLAGLQRGWLTRQDQLWRWSGRLAVTSRLGDVIEARLRSLDGRRREVLELIAAGEPLGPSVLVELAGPGSGSAIDALERGSLTVVERHGRRSEVRLAHPLYGEVLRRHTPTLRSQTVRRQLADAVEELGMRRRDDLLRVAIWRLDGLGTAGPELLTAAARRASVADDDLAERLAAAAVQAGGGVDAGLALGRALYGQRRFREAEQVLDGLTSLAATGQQQADLAIQRSDTLLLLHRYPEAMTQLEAAAATEPDPAMCRRLAPALAKSLIFNGRCREALEVVSTVLAKEPSDQPAFAQAIRIAAWALVLAGRAGEAVATTDLRDRLGESWRDETPCTNELIDGTRIRACLLLGRWDEAQATAEAHYRQSLRGQWSWGVTFWACELMSVALARGKVRTAVRLGQERIAQVSNAGDATLLHLQLVVPLTLAGDLAGAEAAFDRANAASIGRSRLALLMVQEARWWIEAARGNLRGAIDLALDAADLAKSMGVNLSRAVALHDAARLGGAARSVRQLRALAGVMDSPVVRLYAAHASALLAQDGVALDEVAASFEALGAMVLAAEAAAAAVAAHRAAGCEQAARRSAARSAACFSRCEGAWTPLLRPVDIPVRLTPREREIAGLVASGWSNREVAERLVVSVRTVGNHLQHVYDKLGVRRREELGPLVGAPGPRLLSRARQ